MKNPPTATRAHIGLGTQHLEAATHFYSILLGEAPSKTRPGYAKFTPTRPSLNLSLNASRSPVGSESLPVHYGIEVESETDVLAAHERLEAAGLRTELETRTNCCYAVQTKVWVKDPDGNAWEIFVVLEESETSAQPDNRCCEETCCSEQ